MSRHRGARRPHWSKLRRLTEESRLPHGPFLAQDTPLQAQFFGHNAAVPEHNMRPLRPGTEPTPLELRGRATHLHDMGLVDEEDDHLSIRKLLVGLYRVLRHRWRLVLFVWLFTLVPVGGYIVMSVPEYTSEGAVQVSKGSPFGAASPLMEIAAGMGSKAETETEVEILRRRQFIVHALTALRLHVEDADGPGTLSTDLDVTLRGTSPVSDRLRAVRAALGVVEVPSDRFDTTRIVLTATPTGHVELRIGREGEETTHLVEVGQLLEHPEVRLRFDRPPLAPAETITLEVLPEGELLRLYQERIGVGSLGNTRMPTNIVRVFAVHPDRETARSIVQTMMQQYLDQTLEWQSESASKAASFIEAQLDDVRKNLRAAEDKLLSFARAERAVQLDTQARVEIEKAAELEAQRISLELQEKTIGGVLARLSGNASSKASLTANFFDDPVLAASISALTEAETKHEMLKASYAPGHPSFQELERAVQLQRQEVQKLMKSAQRNIGAQKQQIEHTLARLNESMTRYPDKQLELARLTRDMEISQRLYTLLLEKLEEAEIVRASTTTDKRIIDDANLPHDKTSPRRLRALVTGMLGGLLLGVAMAFVSHALQQRLDTVDSIRDITNIPTYGTIPEVSSKGVERLSVKDVWDSPQSSLGEAFRALGVSVSLMPGNPGQGRLLAVTSSQPGEGKSTVSANLAVALSRTEKRVLLVDLDLRRPTQHRMWSIPRQPGYSDLMAHGGRPSDISEFGRSIEGFGVTLLSAGTRLPDPVAAVMNSSLSALLSSWTREFDFVIVDCPPAFVAETLALVQHADLVVIVARPGVIERGNLRHAMDSLARLDVPKGLVLNGVARKHAGDTYGSGYYYYYARNYGTSDDEPKYPVT